MGLWDILQQKQIGDTQAELRKLDAIVTTLPETQKLLQEQIKVLAERVEKLENRY